MVIGILTTFLFPAAAHAKYSKTMFGIYKNHHYVYYPKQNFYYDPFSSNYIVVENGVWVRQLRPPRLFTRININVLPHVDVYVDSYYPNYDNGMHKHRYRLMRYMTPDASYYAFKLPVRYDFSITAYQFYEPRPHIVFVDYNPNYYCHPHKGHGKGHGYGHYKHHDMAWNDDHHDHHDYNHHPYPNHGNGHGNGHPTYGNNNGNHHPGDFHKPDNKPHSWPSNGNGNQHEGKHPGDFHQKNEKQQQPAVGRNPGDFHQKNEKQQKQQQPSNGRSPGDFHQKNEKQQKEQQPAVGRNPGDFHHQNDVERRQEKPQIERRPGDFHSKGTNPSTPAKGPRKKGGH